MNSVVQAATTHRVVLFVDWQNVYKGCRETFDLKGKFHTHGQVNPVEVGRRIVAKYVPGTNRTLAEVRVYTGRQTLGRTPRPMPLTCDSALSGRRAASL
jgi:hypothetical protein